MKARVYVASKPGMWEQYDGYVDVEVATLEEAGDAAKRKLHATSFPDRSPGSWNVERVEVTS